jgi:signal transduction histidine kinase
MPVTLTLLKPAAVLMQLSAQLRLAIDPEAALNASVETIGASLGLPYVAIALHQRSTFVTMAAFGEMNGPVEVLPLVHQYEQMGQLIVGRRDATVPLPQTDKAILGQVAQQISEVLRAIRLQSDLQAARERLVITREEERRRLRRDLHDGLGPALASLSLKVDAAIDLFEPDPATSVRLLGEVKQQAQQLVSEVRQVVNDLRPPTLDELGLVEAVRSAITHLHSHSSALQIRLDADGVPRQLPAAVEAAGYRIIMEAVTNVVKHARARQCAIRLEMLNKPPRMQLTVRDDGSGLPEEVRANVGMRSMRERAEELGGIFEIQTHAASGTCVIVSLPFSEGQAAV